MYFLRNSNKLLVLADTRQEFATEEEKKKTFQETVEELKAHNFTIKVADCGGAGFAPSSFKSICCCPWECTSGNSYKVSPEDIIVLDKDEFFDTNRGYW